MFLVSSILVDEETPVLRILSLPAKSTKFFIVPAAASQLIFASQPSNTPTNSAITPSVVLDIEDQYGNLVTTDDSSVTLAIKPGTGPAGAALEGTTTVIAQSGVAVFSDLLLDETGIFKLKATSSDRISGRSDRFVIYQTID